MIYRVITVMSLRQTRMRLLKMEMGSMKKRRT